MRAFFAQRDHLRVFHYVSLGLPLGLEAPIMTPNGVKFSFLFTLS